MFPSPEGAYKLCTHKNIYVHKHTRTHHARQETTEKYSAVFLTVVRIRFGFQFTPRMECGIRVSMEVAQLLPEPFLGEVFCVPYFKYLCKFSSLD